MKWTEAMIRKEIQRLDEMTGLHGNDLIVDFGNAKRRLGCFITREGKSHKFRFSESTLRMRISPDMRRMMSSAMSMPIT